MKLLYTGKEVYIKNDQVFEKDTDKYLGNCYIDETGDMYLKSPYHNGEILYYIGE